MPEYRADAFYVDATDGRGHSDKLYTSVPPGVFAQVGSLIASKAVPSYRTTADFVRDAIIHRLHWLDENFEVTDSLRDELARVLSLNELHEEQRQEDELTSLVEGYTKRLSRASHSEKMDLRRRIRRDLDTLTMPARFISELENLL